MKHCTNCGFELPSTPVSFCTRCGSRLEAQKNPEAVTNQATTNVGTTETAFLANARVGLNRWWRWVLGSILILVIWQGIGMVPWYVACEYLKTAQIPQFTCDDLSITGDSPLPNYILSNYGFVIGIIGVWLTVKLIHKKTLTQVVTGRVTFDYNRALYAIGIGLFISALILVLNRLFIHSDITFRAPNLWEYVTFFLFVIVLTPYQAAFEEILFRGYLIQGVSLLIRNRLVLVVISGLLFMAPHLLNPEPYEYGFGPYVSYLVMFGVFMSLLTLFDGGIELAVGYHAANNLWIALIANTEVTAMPTPSLFVIPMENYTFPMVIEGFATFTVLFVIFNRKYGWFSWTSLVRTLRHLKIS